MKLITEQKVYLLQFGEQSPGTLAKLNCLLLPRGVEAVPWCHGAMVPLDQDSRLFHLPALRYPSPHHHHRHQFCNQSQVSASFETKNQKQPILRKVIESSQFCENYCLAPVQVCDRALLPSLSLEVKYGRKLKSLTDSKLRSFSQLEKKLKAHLPGFQIMTKVVAASLPTRSEVTF